MVCKPLSTQLKLKTYAICMISSLSLNYTIKGGPSAVHIAVMLSGNYVVLANHINFIGILCIVYNFYVPQ